MPCAKRPLLLLLTLMLPLSAGAYSTGGPFARAGYGARAWGMGGAVVANGGDEGASFWNPALLVLLPESRLGLAYVNLVEGERASQSHLAYARVLKYLPEKRIGRHALGVLYSNLTLGLAGAGSYGENTLTLAYAASPDYFISLGVALDLLLARSEFNEFDASGSSVSGGLRLVLRPGLTLGFAVRNVISRVSFSDGRDMSLNRSFSAAVSLELTERLTVEGDAVTSRGELSRLVVGGEYELLPANLFLRGAVASLLEGESRTVPYLGIGFRFHRFRLDYNADLDSEQAFGDRHRFSLSIRI